MLKEKENIKISILDINMRAIFQKACLMGKESKLIKMEILIRVS
jgi:hypothetical protein